MFNDWRSTSGQQVDLPIHDYHDRNYHSDRNSRAPVLNDNVASDNFERYESGFKDEKVVAGSEAECFINIATSETYERRGNWKICDHLIHACKCVSR